MSQSLFSCHPLCFYRGGFNLSLYWFFIGYWNLITGWISIRPFLNLCKICTGWEILLGLIYETSLTEQGKEETRLCEYSSAYPVYNYSVL